MTRRPKFHAVCCEEYTFCCQSRRVPLAEFAEECVSEQPNGYCHSETAAEIAKQAVRIRVAVRVDSRMDNPYCIWPAAPGDRGSFVAWAWPPPPECDYPRVEEANP